MTSRLLNGDLRWPKRLLGDDYILHVAKGIEAPVATLAAHSAALDATRRRGQIGIPKLLTQMKRVRSASAISVACLTGP